MNHREQLIQYGYDRNFPIEKVNEALNKAGMGSMGPREENLYKSRNWGTTPLGRVAKDAKDIASGINTAWTLGGEMLNQAIQNPQQTFNSLGNYVGQRGPFGIAEDIYNLWASPYGATTKDFQERGALEVLKNLPGAMWAHPGLATLDIGLPLAGKVPRHQLGDMLEKVKAPQAVRQFIPSTNISKANEIINSGRGNLLAQNRNVLRLLSEVANTDKVDLGQVARNLQIPKAGKWEGNPETLKATQKMKEIAQTEHKNLVELGVPDERARQMAQVQYIMETLNPERKKAFTTSDIFTKAILGEDTPRTKKLSKDRLDKLMAESGRLFDEGTIFPLTHRATYKKSGLVKGLVTDEDKLLNFLADRKYGWATPEELAPTLAKGYEATARDIFNAKLGKVSIGDTARGLGRPTSIRQLSKTPPGENEVVISPQAFDKVIAKDFEIGDWRSTKRRINKLVEDGLDPKEYKVFADDLYVIDKDYLRPLKNMANSRKYTNPFNRAYSTWKTAQLVTPKYLIENRLGNWTLNALEGVGLDDYLDAVRFDIGGSNVYKGKFSDIKPERLKADTSYYGVLGEEFQGTKALQASKQSLNKIKQGFKTKDFGAVNQGLFDVVSSPVLSLESQLESVDRYANFIRQAKRMSAKTGESVENIIKRASKDSSLYNELMGKVNRSLGDYVGRNWAINPDVYQTLNFMFPFFKYPTQGLRTLFHQAMERPLPFALGVTTPQRIGHNIWNQQVAKYPSLDKEEGGLVDYYIPGKKGYAHLHQSDIHPLGAGAGMIASGLTDWQRININPLLDLARIRNFKDRFGNPASSPNYINYGGQSFKRDYETGQPLREFAKPGLADRLSYATSWFGNNFVPGVIAWNRAYGPLTASMMGKEWYQNYDTSLLGQIGEGKIPKWLSPLISGKTDRPGKTKEDARLNQMGIRTLKVYPEQSVSSRTYRGVLKKIRRNNILKRIKED